ncbi:MAG TPA: hypothetical protein VFR21_10370 [Bradyrhizobium sp.]|nr:hypothetical protein [Bradyrhizobium sp.]
MAEVSSGLIFEVLKQVQQRLGHMDHKINEVRAGMNAIRGYRFSMMQDLQNVYAVLGRFDGRFDVIEHRLELSEVPTP